jgi:hypothetical protein
LELIARVMGRGHYPGKRGGRTRAVLISLLAGLVSHAAIALDVRSEESPAPPIARAQQVAALPRTPAGPASDARGHEASGRFALPDSGVRGTFLWFRVPQDFDGISTAEPPTRIARVEARGLRTAIAAWWRSGELRIFESETARGGAFRCGCRSQVAGAPAAARVVAEALACMDLPVGPSGLEVLVTRERFLSATGPISRAIRGMPAPDQGAAWSCR